jgi:hypothetical protein
MNGEYHTCNDGEECILCEAEEAKLDITDSDDEYDDTQGM